MSTLNAPAEFWDYIKDNLKEPVTTSLTKEYKFWHFLRFIQTRDDLIKVLRKNLTDEEILSLCEKI